MAKCLSSLRKKTSTSQRGAHVLLPSILSTCTKRGGHGPPSRPTSSLRAGSVVVLSLKHGRWRETLAICTNQWQLPEVPGINTDRYATCNCVGTSIHPCGHTHYTLAFLLFLPHHLFPPETIHAPKAFRVFDFEITVHG